MGATPSGLVTSAHLHHPHISYRLDALPAAQPTASKHRIRETLVEIHSHWLLTPRLWNQPSASFHQPCCSLSATVSHHLAHVNHLSRFTNLTIHHSLALSLLTYHPPVSQILPVLDCLVTSVLSSWTSTWTGSS